MYEPKGYHTLHFMDDPDLDITLCTERRTKRNCTDRTDKVTCISCLRILKAITAIQDTRHYATRT